MQLDDSDELDKLSNLDSALDAIERCSGPEYVESNFKKIRPVLVQAVGAFRKSYYALGHILIAYRDLFKIEKIWMMARKEIAAAMGCHPDHLNRIIRDVEALPPLTPIEIAALANAQIDPGKPKNLTVVKALAAMPKPSTESEADAAVAHVVGHHKAARNLAKVKPVPGSLEEFAARLAKLVTGYFAGQSLAQKMTGIKYCFELMIAALHVDVPDLRKHSCIRDVPAPKD
jgi:hypothetical protein